MIKIITMLKRKSDLTPDDFSQYWHEKHGPLALKVIPEAVRSVIRKYVQNHPIKLGEGEGSLYDGVAEICFDDLKAFRKWTDWYFSDDGKVLRDDEENFMDKSKRIIVVAEERVMIS